MVITKQNTDSLDIISLVNRLGETGESKTSLICASKISTILHDVSGADESTADEGNCINAKLDQYLSEPMNSCQDDFASLWEHAWVPSLVDTGTEIPATTTY